MAGIIHALALSHVLDRKSPAGGDDRLIFIEICKLINDRLTFCRDPSRLYQDLNIFIFFRSSLVFRSLHRPAASAASTALQLRASGLLERAATG